MGLWVFGYGGNGAPFNDDKAKCIGLGRQEPSQGYWKGQNKMAVRDDGLFFLGLLFFFYSCGLTLFG